VALRHKERKKIDKFEATEFKPIPSKEVKPPAIDGATVAYECKVVDQFKTGDHTVYVADVVAIHGNPEKINHLYSIHYKKLISIGSNANINMDLGV